MSNDLKSLALKVTELYAKLAHAETFEHDRGIIVYKEEIQETRKKIADLLKEKSQA